MRLFFPGILALIVVAAEPAVAGDPAQPDGVELALTIETTPSAIGSTLQPPVAASAVELPQADSQGRTLSHAPKASPGAAASSFAEEADPSETGSTTAPEPVEPPVTKLIVAGWGGAYGQALRKAILDPFRDTGKIEIESIAAVSGTSLPPPASDWDVADVSAAVARRACSAGELALLDQVQPRAEEFIPGSIGRCGIGSLAWSSLVLVDPKAFRKGLPETLADVFDGRRFKQKRAFARSPRYLLEMALLADGVPPGRVYGELSTREGMKRAFKKLDGIRKLIVWADKPEAAVKLLGRGEVGMATAFSGRAFYAIASELKPYRMIWDGQIYDLSVWVVSNRSRAKAEALDFVSFATKADRLAAFARWYPYGPLRLSAVGMVGRHPTLGIDLAPFLPTAEANMTSALRFNELFWQHNEAPLKQSLEAWIKGEPHLPKAAPPTGAEAREF